MNDDLRHRRRAVYTGLQPYLDEEQLRRALEHWQRHYARAPRFRLQRFVHEVCQLAELGEHRPDIHRSLVRAMTLPAESLLQEPEAPAWESEHADADQRRAFVLLLDALIAGVPGLRSQQLCLDLLSSLRRDRFPQTLREELRNWLIERDEPRLDATPAEALRALINRSWALLTERLGPETADRLLHQACDQVRAEAPELADALARLL